MPVLLEKGLEKAGCILLGVPCSLWLKLMYVRYMLVHCLLANCIKKGSSYTGLTTIALK